MFRSPTFLSSAVWYCMLACPSGRQPVCFARDIGFVFDNDSRQIWALSGMPGAALVTRQSSA